MTEEPMWTRSQVEKFITAVMENYGVFESHWPNLPWQSGLELNDKSPVPPFQSRTRINGNVEDNDPGGHHFLKAGYMHLQLIKRLYETYTGGGTFEKARVLDWGVGCGRMIRHIPKSMADNVYGADVDRVNIEWLTTNMEFGHYFLLHPTTPMPIEDNFFDLIYSFSVMTHLTEDEQFFWLQELSRVCRGLMIISVHGPRTLSRHHSLLSFAEWVEKGYVDSGANKDIVDVVGDNYYRNVAHTPKYIYENWSKYVDVIDIIPGVFAGATHDAVVCKPKDS